MTLTGVISDQTFGSTLASAHIFLYEVEAGGGQSNLIGQLTTSASGAYTFTFTRNQVESYTIVIEKTNYFSVEKWFQPIYIV